MAMGWNDAQEVQYYAGDRGDYQGNNVRILDNKELTVTELVTAKLRQGLPRWVDNQIELIPGNCHHSIIDNVAFEVVNEHNKLLVRTVGTCPDGVIDKIRTYYRAVEHYSGA